MVMIPNYPCGFYHQGRCSHLGRRGWFGAKECVLLDPFVGSCRKMVPPGCNSGIPDLLVARCPQPPPPPPKKKRPPTGWQGMTG